MDKDLERILTRNYKESMIQFIKENPSKIDELIKIIFEIDNPLSWRGAWLLWSCVSPIDIRLQNNIEKFIDLLPISRESMQRELLKILYMSEIPESHLGKLFNTCINIWEDISKRPGVRYTAIKVIFKISDQYPELKNEIKYLIDDRFMNTLSPGIKHSLKKFYILGLEKAFPED